MLGDGRRLEAGQPATLQDGETFAVGHPDYRFVVLGERS